MEGTPVEKKLPFLFGRWSDGGTREPSHHHEDGQTRLTMAKDGAKSARTRSEGKR